VNRYVILLLYDTIEGFFYSFNDSDEPRLTATDRSGSEGSERSSVGLDRLVMRRFQTKPAYARQFSRWRVQG
jgi:hypothetical protein